LIEFALRQGHKDDRQNPQDGNMGWKQGTNGAGQRQSPNTSPNSETAPDNGDYAYYHQQNSHCLSSDMENDAPSQLTLNEISDANQYSNCPYDNT
jgi:hypothetical protein